jgi:hypothetical protein
MACARRVFWSNRQRVPYGFSYNSPTIQCLYWSISAAYRECLSVRCVPISASCDSVFSVYMENIDPEKSDKDHLGIGRLFDRPSSSMFKQLAPNPGLLMAAYLPNLGDVSEYFSC